jgi:hypothetical protein
MTLIELVKELISLHEPNAFDKQVRYVYEFGFDCGIYRHPTKQVISTRTWTEERPIITKYKILNFGDLDGIYTTSEEVFARFQEIRNIIVEKLGYKKYNNKWHPDLWTEFAEELGVIF